MSLQSLISGAECAVSSNPLSQVLKHTEGDRSLQQDRVAGPSSSRLQHLPGTASTQSSDHDVALARQFFGGPQDSVAPTIAMPPQMYSPDFAPLRDLAARSSFPHAFGGEVQQVPHAVYQQAVVQGSWASEFSGVPKAVAPSVQTAVHQASGAQLPRTGMYNYAMPMGNQGFVVSPFLQNLNPSIAKGKAREADFEAAFVQAMASFRLDSESSARVVELEEGAAAQTNGEARANPDLAEVLSHIRESHPSSQEDVAKFEADFNQLMAAQRDELEHDYGGAMQDAWERGLGDYTRDDVFKLDEHGYPVLGDYIFEQDNRYLNQSSSARSLLDEAKGLLERNGSLSEAALLLEAAIQKGELGEGGYEAWLLLGEARSMDEREEHAMRALSAGVRLAEAASANGAGMLSLAISYTNESHDRACYLMLLRWLRARFPAFPVSEGIENAVATHSTWSARERLTDVFVALARQQYEQGVVDADVQCALGILFYNASEYSRAKDCFESALNLRPQDYQLWNRVGSCLSNGNKPEEALGVYREALKLRPTYTRAIYNVGVACLNIGAHKEAAEHFLSALAMQDASGANQMSNQVWQTLHRALVHMDRGDLAELANRDNRSNLSVFREHGFDF